ncbi:MAG: histidine kinase dimerization/phospho-acceptor domain-containing protein, partial [Mitsuokella sp.]
LEESNTMKEQWIRGVSHDLRNPLMLISGYNSQLEQQYGRGKQKRLCTLTQRGASLIMTVFPPFYSMDSIIWIRIAPVNRRTERV